MKILFFGDVFGRDGRKAVAETLPRWKKEHQPEIVIANAENSATGSGTTPKVLDELITAGVDAFTFGDHYFVKDFAPLVDYPIVRPSNLSEATHGSGIRLIETPLHKKLLLFNLVGYAFHKTKASNFFDEADTLLKQHIGDNPDAIFLDFHAEASSEMNALGIYLDGRVSAVVGTHTHVPTADTKILPRGTAYQTDVGMCGPLNSVIGMGPTQAQNRLRKEMGEEVGKIKFEDPGPPLICDAVLIETDGPSKSKSIKRLTTRPQG